MPKGEKSQTVKSESKSAKSPSAKSPSAKSPESKAKKTKKVVEEAAPVEEVAAVEPVVEKKVKKTKKKAEETAPVEEPVVEESAPVEKKVKKVKKVKDPNAPKKELNPIMKEMNKFRNEVIGAVLGSKAPKVTIPPFKLAMADAREKMGLSEKDKNTVETVLKAVELFNKNNKKYL